MHVFALLAVFVLDCRPSEVRAAADPAVPRAPLCHRSKCLVMIISFSANTRAGVLPRLAPSRLPSSPLGLPVKFRWPLPPKGCSHWTWIQKTWVSVPVLPFANRVLWQAAKWVLASSSVKGWHCWCPWWGRSVLAAVEHLWTVKLFTKVKDRDYSHYYPRTHTILGIKNSNFTAFIT